MSMIFGKRPADYEQATQMTPGITPPEEQMDERVGGLLMLQGKPQTVIGEKEITKAQEILATYKEGKANFENRVVDDEQWWKLRHWEALRKTTHKENGAVSPEPTSAWLFNAILNKHADALDNFPEPLVLPRERMDEQTAKTLQSILPVILEGNGFEQTYSDQWWEKLKHGSAVYGVFWNSEKENGLGDIDIRGIDLLNIFWEPGITDIQDSRNLFITDLIDNEVLEDMYPDLKGKIRGNAIDVKQYIYDDTINTEDKSVVVDWYYKLKSPEGKTVLHYCKFVAGQVLYATENDPNYQYRGLYDHGDYPIIVDVLFPEKGTPMGFGYVATCKSPQMDIDKLSANVLETSMMNTKRRWFASTSTNINKSQFLDWNEPIIDVEGELSDTRLQPLQVGAVSAIDSQYIQMKIDEMKETVGNRDVTQGGASSGVTAASAIAALQEAGNKPSRDIISASYRAYQKMISMTIELIRQFYDDVRTFRITNDMGSYEFMDVSNQGLADQPTAFDIAGNPTMFRRPVFDFKVKAQKKSPFSRMEENERAKELYAMGFFNPQRAQESLIALSMMDFEGIDKVREQISQGQTLMSILSQISGMTGVPFDMMAAGGAPMSMPNQAPQNGISDQVMKAQTPMTSYGQRLAARSTPNLNNVPTGATPK